MNIEQFERFQAAVQWAVDESKRANSKHDQDSWAVGTALPDMVDPVGFDFGDDDDTPRFFFPVSCNTSMCLAGNGVMAAGDTFVIDVDDVVPGEEGEAVVDFCMDQQGIVHVIEDRATELFGFDRQDVNIFYIGNSIEMLIERAKNIASKYTYELTLKR